MQEGNTPMSPVTIPKASLVLVLQQVILSNCRAKDCGDLCEEQQHQDELRMLSRGHSETWLMSPLIKPWFQFQIKCDWTETK